MANTTKPTRRHPMRGTTTAGIESALLLHIIDGIPIRVAATKCGCSASGLAYAKRKHLARIKAMADTQK